jgi:hypothetical protein
MSPRAIRTLPDVEPILLTRGAGRSMILHGSSSRSTTATSLGAGCPQQSGRPIPGRPLLLREINLSRPT